ncbi:GNAT family N-acetyltransferase [Alteromonas halophila]|uniref:N-acetyltransferase domain-containing protein n=1 Tax=Alteromonas halophila TaxID=516698 RepID=A0A918N0S7_9ALTE|nr:GNAT family N-acetyltransferase [Alteromonas halophila]GGW91116.1 hypothetical protein GCM10007391_26790 [Alteromonas halophila]
MVTLRAAEQTDGEVATELLMQAAGALLTDIFGNGDEARVRRYLFAAWHAGEGQYGYKNHWVACQDERVIGLVTCWHNQLPENFDRATLDVITAHFGLDESLNIVMRSQVYSSALHPPTDTQMAIGHLAITPDCRRQGVGRRLLDEMQALAVSLGKTALVLDVEQTNHSAIDFYLANQFSTLQHCPPFQHMYKPL